MADPRPTLDPDDYQDVDIDDEDNPEWTEADFANARPLVETFPELAESGRKFRARAVRDVELTLSHDLFEAFSAREPQWRARMEALLEAALRRELEGRPSAKRA